jgi:hypothetical protein
MILGYLRSFAKQVLLILFIQNLNEPARLRGRMCRRECGFVFWIAGFIEEADEVD